MPKKKLTPPTWDEKGKRWRKNAYCGGVRKMFCSKKRGITSAEKEIELQINAWKEKMEGLSSSGKLSPMSRVSDVYRDYKMDLETRTSKGHFIPVEGRFEGWIIPVIGRCSVMDLNDGLLQKVINNAYIEGHLSYKTLLNIRADMMSFVKFCRKYQITNYIPTDIIIPKSAARSEKKILQPDELKILFSSDISRINGQMTQEPYVYAFRLQVLHCLRPGEVGGLKKSDRIDDIVHVQRSINSNQEITQGKNQNAVRAFVLSDIGKECWDALASLSDSDWLLPNYTTKLYYHRLKKYCIANNITPISPYELHHTSFSVMQTLPEGLVKSAGGHSKNMDTFGIYGHEVQGDMELTAKLLNNRFSDLLCHSENQ